MSGDSLSVRYENWSNVNPVCSSIVKIAATVTLSAGISFVISKACNYSPLYVKIWVITDLFNETAKALYNTVGVKYFNLQKHDILALRAATLTVLDTASIVVLAASNVIGTTGIFVHSIFAASTIYELVKKSMQAQSAVSV